MRRVSGLNVGQLVVRGVAIALGLWALLDFQSLVNTSATAFIWLASGIQTMLEPMLRIGG